ncbi:MAG: hypothetical protein IJC57_00140 [Clostridia bacterium]|nr:hypothetical protein [Clostridia bacterium]
MQKRPVHSDQNNKQKIQFSNLLSFAQISSFTKSEKIFDNRENMGNTAQ